MPSNVHLLPEDGDWNAARQWIAGVLMTKTALKREEAVAEASKWRFGVSVFRKVSDDAIKGVFGNAYSDLILEARAIAMSFEESKSTMVRLKSSYASLLACIDVKRSLRVSKRRTGLDGPGLDIDISQTILLDCRLGTGFG